jgi:pyridoxamine 5'-phosphate oxidase
MDPDLSRLRKEYALGGLDERDLDADPFAQFRVWLDAALEARLADADAMTLATADAEGRPSARIVLLKGADDRGLVYFTNYESRKGRDLAENPRAALLFFWGALERQVRVEGRVERTSAAESDAYFASRPFGSRIGAVASAQSAPLASRDELEGRVAELSARYEATGEVPRPVRWGGYRVVPDRFAFWQGRESRLHDRLVYLREGVAWRVERLQP